VTGPRLERRYRLAVVNTHPIQYFAPLYRRIAESRDIDITVYYCSRQGLEKGFIDAGFGKEVVWDIPLLEGYPHQFLPNLGGDRGVRGFLSLLNPSIVNALWKGKYDAVLVYGHAHATDLLAMTAARLSGTRIFMRCDTHLLLRRSGIKRLLRRPLMTAFYKTCDACLYIGSRNRDFYVAHGVPAAKLFPSPFAVDNAAFSARADASRSDCSVQRTRLRLPQGIPIVLAASKLVPQKRPFDLLMAHAQLSRRGIGAVLLFVGDGSERTRLEDTVQSLSVPNVRFVGFVNQGDLPAYYALADVFVLPSGNETWGLAVNEAMSCGVPVITTREVGAAADLVAEGETGFTYETGDVSALADSMAKVLTNRPLREAMSRNCVRRMSTWSYAESIQGLRDALQASAPRAIPSVVEGGDASR